MKEEGEEEKEEPTEYTENTERTEKIQEGSNHRKGARTILHSAFFLLH
jgi:hypothetical protein